MNAIKRVIRRLLSKEILNIYWHYPRAIFAALWFRFPARRITVVAVAGTKGKTTTTFLTARILTAAGHRTAMVSTAGVSLGEREELNAVKMTTPSAWWLQGFLRRAVRVGCTHAVLEISSHALLQHRTYGVPLTVAVLTNLMPDHLEYHRDAAEYQNTHKLLLTSTLRALVINGDDPDLQSFTHENISTRTFSAHSELAERIRALPLALLGEFNLMNACAAATAAQALDAPWDAISSVLRDSTPIPGRLERIDAGQPFTVIVDYAHSPESLESIYSAVAQLQPNRIITVFGACGDRDPKKRPLMGEIIARHSDIIIVTNDDPFTENPEKIATELIAGIAHIIILEMESGKNKKTSWKILDRRSAIAKAIDLAQPGDLVLALGKGAEQWQVFKDKKIPWDDRKIVREILAR